MGTLQLQSDPSPVPPRSSRKQSLKVSFYLLLLLFFFFFIFGGAGSLGQWDGFVFGEGKRDQPFVLLIWRGTSVVYNFFFTAQIFLVSDFGGDHGPSRSPPPPSLLVSHGVTDVLGLG
jgi:hypothetical protein